MAEAVAHVGARPACHAANPDAEVLRETQQWTRSRAVMIKMGLIQPGRHRTELEWSVSPASLAYEEIDADPAVPLHAFAGGGSAAD